MANLTLIVFGKALVDLGVDEEQLGRHGVAVQPFATEEVSSLAADCALLTGNVGREQLLAQIHMLRSQVPQCRLMVSMPDIIQDVIVYLQAGVSGILKPPVNAAMLGGRRVGQNQQNGNKQYWFFTRKKHRNWQQMP